MIRDHEVYEWMSQGFMRKWEVEVYYEQTLAGLAFYNMLRKMWFGKEE